MKSNSFTDSHTWLESKQAEKIVLTSLVFVTLCGALGADELSDTIKNAICNSYGKIRTLQLVQTIKTHLPDLPQPTRVCELTVEGKCFYSSSKVRNNFFEHAFDGSVFSKLSPDGEMIILVKVPEYGFPLPHSLALSWLGDCGLNLDTNSITIENLKDELAWKRRFEDASFLSSEDVGTDMLHTYRFPSTKMIGYVFEVQFSESHGYMPKRWLLKKEGTLMGELEVGDFVDFPEIPLSLPMQAELKCGDVTMKINVAQGSVKVNEPIDRSLFSISPTRAKSIYDEREIRKRIEAGRKLELQMKK